MRLCSSDMKVVLAVAGKTPVVLGVLGFKQCTIDADSRALPDAPCCTARLCSMTCSPVHELCLPGLSELCQPP